MIFIIILSILIRKGLLKSIHTIGSKDILDPIKGSVPNLYNLPEGCNFYPRCDHAINKCKNKIPPYF